MNLNYVKRQVRGLSLHMAESDSEEPTLLLLHGVTRRWQTFLPMVAPLATRQRLVMVDFRGHGLSDPGENGYRVVDYVDDICELITNDIDGPVSVYGHSLGAMTAAGVAARLGDRLTSVVMEDPPLQTMGTGIAKTPLLSYFSGVSKFAGDTRDVRTIAEELGQTEFQDPVSGDVFRIGDTRDAAQLRFAASCLQKLDPAVFGPILASEWLADYDIDDVYSAIKCPALLLQADYAAGGMMTDQDAEHVADLNRNIAHVRFPGVPHGIHWTATLTLLNSLLPFLESAR